MAQNYCECMDEQCRIEQFDGTAIRTDRYDGMVTRVQLLTCRTCGRQWIHYSTDHETRAGWGKWYRGLMDASGDDIAVEEAYHILDSLPWHFYGGAYFRTSGERAAGPVKIGGLGAWLEAA